MNMIYKWSQIISENKKDLNQINEENITITDELGKKINDIIQPDMLNNKDGSTKDLWDADFKCNISTTNTLVSVLPDIPKNIIPKNSSFIIFMCDHLALDPNRMVSYINSKCADVLPFKLDVDDVIYLGSYDRNRSYKNRQDLFVISKEKFNSLKSERYFVNLAIKKLQIKFPDEFLRGTYGTKETLLNSSFFKKQNEILNTLNDTDKYLILLAIKNTLSPIKQLKIVDDINDSASLTDKDFSFDDIIKLGVIKAKNKTGSIINFDVFGVKIS